MASSKYEETVFYDLVINYFMNNPALYDKLEEKYSFTVEKLDKLMILSNYLKELNIHKSVPEIIHAWQDLVKQYKKYLAKSGSSKVGSGSAAPDDDNFPYYKHLMFLKPALQHRPVVSTVTPSTKTPVPTADPFENEMYYSSFDMGHITDVAAASCSWIPPRTSTVARTVAPSSKPSSCSSRAETSFMSSSNTNKVSAFKSTSVPCRRTLNVPEFDNFAKKKMKEMVNHDETINVIGKKIIETLDHVNNIKMMDSKGMTKESTNNDSCHEVLSQSIDYKNHLIAAVSKIPAGYEDDCMEYIIEELEKFDKQQSA